VGGSRAATATTLAATTAAATAATAAAATMAALRWHGWGWRAGAVADGPTAGKSGTACPCR
jgi:hypothetical protein